MIACERLDRRCFAIEIDPAYCDVIRRRYREYTGGT
jgi:DNA modification methylase